MRKRELIARVKNWPDHQHYKDRRPPWIKLHRDLLDDQDYMCLPLASMALAPLIWLLASEHQDGTSGEVNIHPSSLAFRLRRSVEEIREAVKPLIDEGFLECDSKLLAECYPHATPETEGETEVEVEREGEKEAEKETEVAAGSKNRPAPRRKSSQGPAPSTLVWEAYAAAYERRYGVAPTRNQKVNGQLANFIRRVPADEAPLIAAYYVTLNERFYVTKMHPIGMLLQDAEKLRTLAVTGDRMTAARAAQSDRQDERISGWNRVISQIEHEGAQA